MLVAAWRRGQVAVLVIAMPAFGSAAAAQEASAPAEIAPSAPVSSSGWNGVEVWGGLASGSPSWGVLGQLPGMNLGIVALRISRPLGKGATEGTGSRLTEFTVDFVPFVRVSPSYISLRGTGTACTPGRICMLLPPASSQHALFPEGSPRGFGLNPAGITTRFRRDRSVSPWLGAAVGALWFDKNVPSTRSARFNFTAALEAGLRLGPPREPGITVSYRFHHLSNAGTAGENPGLASHLVSIGIHGWRRVN